MRLATAIEIFAGGPGSGCKGPNCGRPSTDAGNGATVKLQQGDTVVLMKPGKFYNEKRFWWHDYPPGTKAVVRNVKPAFGLHEEMVRVAPKGTARDGEWVKRSDVYLHKADTIAPQVVPPVRKSKTLQSFKTADGARVTTIRPSTAGKFRNPQQLTKEKHPGKGQFKDISKALYKKGFRGKEKPTIPMFDIRKMKPADGNTKVFYWQKSPHDKLEGTTVFVHKYYSGPKQGVVIHEFNAGEYGQATQRSEYRLGQKWQYSGMNEFRYKNFGAASGLLNKRYGIKIKLKDL